MIFTAAAWSAWPQRRPPVQSQRRQLLRELRPGPHPRRIFDELRRPDWVPRSVHEKAARSRRPCARSRQTNGSIPYQRRDGQGHRHALPNMRSCSAKFGPPLSFASIPRRGAGQEGEPPATKASPTATSANPRRPRGATGTGHMIAERLEQLPEAQRKVLALYYFEDLRLREIAEAFGVTESRICQIHAAGDTRHPRLSSKARSPSNS